MSEMNFTSGTKSGGFNTQPVISRSSDIPCTGKNLVKIKKLIRLRP